MASTGTSARVDQGARTILATAKAIYQAMVDPEAISAWRAPKGMTLRIERFDPRVGGGYRMSLFYPEELRHLGKTEPGRDSVVGKFVELAPFERIVEEVAFTTSDPALKGTMRVTTTLSPVADGTKVTIACEDVPPGISAEDHAVGIASTLKNLALFLE